MIRFLLISLVFIVACDTNKSVNTISWFHDAKNGFKKTRSTHSLKIDIFYQPPVYIIAQEIHDTGIIDNNKIDSLKRVYNSSHRFIIEISPLNGGEELFNYYTNLLQSNPFSIDKNIQLLSNNTRFDPAICHIVKGTELAQKIIIIAIFEIEELNNFSFIFSDERIGIAKQYFSFNIDNLRIPNLKV